VRGGQVQIMRHPQTEQEQVERLGHDLRGPERDVRDRTG
jgi:hypothetical protein